MKEYLTDYLEDNLSDINLRIDAIWNKLNNREYKHNKDKMIVRLATLLNTRDGLNLVLTRIRTYEYKIQSKYDYYLDNCIKKFLKEIN